MRNDTYPGWKVADTFVCDGITYQSDTATLEEWCSCNLQVTDNDAANRLRCETIDGQLRITGFVLGQGATFGSSRRGWPTGPAHPGLALFSELTEL